MNDPSEIDIAEFDYDLPEENIAKFPLAERDHSKLLVYKNDKIQEDKFYHLVDYLPEGSTLVFNDTKVIQARLNFSNSNGGNIEIFCLEPHSGIEISRGLSEKSVTRWRCLVGNLKRWKEPFLESKLATEVLRATIVEKLSGYVVIEFSWLAVEKTFAEILSLFGEMPIPPYLDRHSEASDAKTYQTVYSKHEGSVAAPTAGLHFTDKVLQTLDENNIQRLNVTLHVGAGTFMPVKSATIGGHEMHAEWLEVSANTVSQLIQLVEEKIIAVGTTSMRTLETLYWMGVKIFIFPQIQLQELEIEQWESYRLAEKNLSARESLEHLLKWMQKNAIEKLICKTRILIAPPYQLRLTAGIVTNFHQPKSTLLLLISAIVGKDKWKEIYAYALKNNFRFLSYGDSSLLLK